MSTLVKCPPFGSELLQRTILGETVIREVSSFPPLPPALRMPGNEARIIRDSSLLV